MSSSPAANPSSPTPRRSQREKRPTKHFATGKRKRTDENDGAPETTEPEDAQGLGENDSGDADMDEGEEDYRAPKSKPTPRKGKSKAPKAKGPPLPKKPRVAKATGSKPLKATVRRGRKLKEGDDAYDAAQVAKDTKITADNPLFNAVMNPAAALQSTTEDFLESLEQSPGAAQAELINLILRSCGCNDSVDADEVLDYDGVVDALDTFTEGLKQDNSPVYPLTSKLPIFKKFRRGLSEFLERLIASSAELGVLYTSDLMSTLQTWVIAMSSSQIRSFRHTATVVALEVETALCDVAAAVEKEAEVVGRQREGEKKRKASNKAGGNKAGGARDKELETKAQEIRERRTKLAEYLKEFVDGVFIHRYRDLDPTIRAECVRAIGAWFKKYPGHFLDASYLRYVGWVLSDSTTTVRVEAVKSLSGVYAQTDYIGSLNHFTERFKPRLIEMATSDTELAVRVAVIQVLSAIDGHSLLEDEERDKMCLLIFDEEAKVRRAVSGFVRGMWEEVLEERLVGRGKPSEEDRQRAGVKALAMLLVKWGRVLDGLVGEPEDSEIGDDEEESGRVEGSSRPGKRKRKEVAALVDAGHKGRTALAVEALWEDVECIRDWEGLLEILLLDHSAAEGVDGKGPRANGKARKRREEEVDEAWRLEEVEESVLLEVLVTALRRAKADVAGSKKGEEENVVNDITRELIKGIPRLFIKHQTDQNRIADVLVIPTLMNLDLYLEMRMITAYASLWDDVAKQFLSHSSLNVLTHAMATIRHFMDATSLSNTNSSKILELEDELSSALRDTVGGRDEIEVASFTEDEVLSLGALCMRLAVLAGTRNMTAWIEEDEGGKQSSAWDIVSAIVERGRLGYKEEETMIEQALHVLTLHIMWKGKELVMSEPEPTPEEIRYRDSLITQRESLLEKLVEYAVGTQSNTVAGVKRAAFKHLLDLHVLFAAPDPQEGTTLPTATVSLSLDDEVQYRCAGYIQAEIERYAESLGFGATDDNDDDEGEKESGAEESSDGEQGDETKKAKLGKGKKTLKEVDTSSRAQLEEEYIFMDVMSTFLRSLRAGAIHIRHGAILLAHYGRLGPAFDICSKVIVDVLRDEGMLNNNGEIVVSVLTQALEEAYTLVLDGVVHDETNALQLSKLLATCFAIRGSQLSIVRRLDSQYVVQIHTDLLSWIAKRLVTYDKNKNKRSIKSAAAFFKVLVPLLGTIQSRDALKVKAHLDQVLAQSNLEVSPTSKIWDGQRAYEKRLTTAMSKDKPGAAKKRTKKGDKDAAGMTSGEEGSDGEGLTGDEHETHDPPARPRRSGLRTRTRNTEPQSDADQVEDQDEPGPATPKPRLRPKPRPAKKAIPRNEGNTDAEEVPTVTEEVPEVPEPSLEPSVELSPVAGTVAEAQVNGFETPKASRKRPRPDDDEQRSTTLDEENTADEADGPSELLTPPDDGIQFRRKRVRH